LETRFALKISPLAAWKISLDFIQMSRGSKLGLIIVLLAPLSIKPIAFMGKAYLDGNSLSSI
jgi:hypothetical protein